MLCYVMLCYVMLSSMRCMPPGERGLWGGEAQVGGRARDIIRVGWGGEGDEPGQVRPSQVRRRFRQGRAGQVTLGIQQKMMPAAALTTRWSIHRASPPPGGPSFQGTGCRVQGASPPPVELPPMSAGGGCTGHAAHGRNCHPPEGWQPRWVSVLSSAVAATRAEKCEPVERRSAEAAFERSCHSASKTWARARSVGVGEGEGEGQRHGSRLTCPSVEVDAHSFGVLPCSHAIL